MMQNKWIERRIALENIGDSVIDDANIKQLVKEYVDNVATLLKERDHDSLIHTQGVLHGLKIAIDVLRRQKREEATREDSDD